MKSDYVDTPVTEAIINANEVVSVAADKALTLVTLSCDIRILLRLLNSSNPDQLSSKAADRAGSIVCHSVIRLVSFGRSRHLIGRNVKMCDHVTLNLIGRTRVTRRKHRNIGIFH